MKQRDGRPRVALVVDHPQRDLAGLVLTAWALCQRGVVCHLVPLNLQERELLALAPDLVLLNYLRLGNEDVARLLLGAGVRVGMLDTEGAVWSDCGAYTELIWQDHDLLRQVRPACMWGPRMADCLLTKGLVEPAQLVVTGCPRFDLYHHDWQPILRSPSAAAAPRILINTNFSGINPRFATSDQNRCQFAESFGWDEERIARHFELERQGIAGMISLARDLAKDFPSAQVTVRPHPFEDPAVYEHALRDVGRIQITNERPIQTEIFQAAVVIQRSCSTAIEAAMAGVPTLSPRWVATPVEIPIAEDVSVPCQGYLELRARVEEVLSGRGDTPSEVRQAQAVVTSDYFHCLDGRSHARVAEAAMASLDPAQTSIEACIRALYRIDRPSNSVRAGLAARVRRGLRLSPYWCFREGRAVLPLWWGRGGKAYDTSDVTQLMQRVLRAASEVVEFSASPVIARSAEAAGEYVCRFEGYSQVLELEMTRSKAEVASAGTAVSPTDRMPVRLGAAHSKRDGSSRQWVRRR